MAFDKLTRSKPASAERFMEIMGRGASFVPFGKRPDPPKTETDGEPDRTVSEAVAGQDGEKEREQVVNESKP